MSSVPPRIYDYLDHVDYLAAWLEWRRERHPRSSSYRGLEMKGGPPASTFANVMARRRLPTEDTILALQRLLRWGTQEREYFGLLVELARHRNDHRELLERLFAHEGFRHARLLDRETLSWIADWHIFAVRDLACLESFQEDPAWIAERLAGLIDEEQAAQALVDLEAHGLLIRDEEGRLRPEVTRVNTPPEAHGVASFQVHRDVLRIAADALDTVHADDRYFGFATVQVPRTLFPRLRGEVFRFIQGMAALGDTDSAEPEELVQLNVQLFRIARAPTDESPE